MSEASTAPRPRRVRPALRGAAVVACIVLVPILAHRVWDYVEIRRLVAEIEAIKARGEPVTEWQAVGPPPRRADDTAGPYYMAGAMLAFDAGASREAARFRQWLAVSRPGETPPPKSVEELAGIVAASADALALADKGAARAFAGLSPGTEFNYRAASLAALATLVSARTLHLAATGDGDAAVQSALVWLALRGAIRDTLWVDVGAHDVSAVLSLSRPSGAALARLQEGLGADDQPDQVARILLRERARYLDAVWRRSYGASPDAPRAVRMPLSGTLARPVISRQATAALRVWAEALAVVRGPRRDWAAGLAAIERRYPRPASGSGPGLFSAAIGGIAAAGVLRASVQTETLSMNRASLVAVAVERYRRDHADAPPPALTDLVPRYLDALVMDSYAGEPLRYRLGDGDYVVYSVGADAQDDGGDVTSELRVALSRGATVTRARGRDEGVRIRMR